MASKENYLGLKDTKSTKVSQFFENHKELVNGFADYMERWQKCFTDKDIKDFEYVCKFTIGKTYIKMICHGSVHAFVDKYGNLYKAASWAAPAKNVRYYIDQKPPVDKFGSCLYGGGIPKRDDYSFLTASGANSGTSNVQASNTSTNANTQQSVANSQPMRKVVNATLDKKVVADVGDSRKRINASMMDSIYKSMK